MLYHELRMKCAKYPPEGLCLRPILWPTLWLVGPGTPGEATVRGVVACDVSDPVAAGGRALDELLAVLAPAVDPPKGHGATEIRDSVYLGTSLKVVRFIAWALFPVSVLGGPQSRHAEGESKQGTTFTQPDCVQTWEIGLMNLVLENLIAS